MLISRQYYRNSNIFSKMYNNLILVNSNTHKAGLLISLMFRIIYKKIRKGYKDIKPFYTVINNDGTKIPKCVYQTWKETKLPSLHALSLERFRKLNIDYTFKFYDDNDMAKYMRDNFSDHPVLDVFEKIKIPASKADIWRYCILYKEGGVYCDIDSALAIPLNYLLRDDPPEMLSFENNTWNIGSNEYYDTSIFTAKASEFVASKIDYPENTVLNWLICFEKGHPILSETIDLIVRQFPYYDNKKFESIWTAVVYATGPNVFTQAVHNYIEKSGRRPNQCGIDFDGYGIFKIPGSGDSYTVSPHYVRLKNRSLT